MASTNQHAVVVGASIAGVLAAQVLAGHFERVTLVDRDEMPREPDPRGGVPQGRHVHGLLSRGREVVEAMFPGTTEDLVARGAILGDAQAEAATSSARDPSQRARRTCRSSRSAGRSSSGTSGTGSCTTPGSTVLEHTSVLDLAFSAHGGRVGGVIVTDRDGGSPRMIAADLVVDASGRTSRTPEWLERRAYAAPPEEIRRVDKQYATRMFRRTSEPGQPLVRRRRPGRATPRGGIMLAREGEVWMVSLAGRNGEQPPLELDEYRAWARTLATPEIADAIDTLVPLDDGVRYRFPANRRRHYEKLRDFPVGLVVDRRRAVRLRPGLRPGDDGRGRRGRGARRLPDRGRAARPGHRFHRRGGDADRHPVDDRRRGADRRLGSRCASASWTPTWPGSSGPRPRTRSWPPPSCGSITWSIARRI